MTQPATHNVLIAAPSNAVSRTLLTTLTQRSMRGLLADESAKAMERLTTNAIRMAFVECPPQREDRLALLARIRREWPDLPMVAIVAEGDVSGAVTAARAGAGEVLTAPIDATALTALLDRYLPDHTVAASEETAGVVRLAGRSGTRWQKKH